MRKSLLTILVSLAITAFVFAHSARGAETSEQPTSEDAQNLLKESFPDVKVLDVRPAQVNGLFEVVLEQNGQKGIIYIDSSKKYLISGSILDVKTKTNFTQERYNEINKVDVSKIPLDDALVMGEKDAKHRVVVFDDPE
jgi:thiol:disulfide interchange protein DsbC